jgi:hypothetical protein
LRTGAGNIDLRFKEVIALTPVLFGGECKHIKEYQKMTVKYESGKPIHAPLNLEQHLSDGAL